MISSFWWCQLLANSFWWECFWWRRLLVIFRTSFLQMLSWNSIFLFIYFIAPICSSEPMLHLKTLKFLSLVLHTWTNISIFNWHFLIHCYHQNLKGNVKHILFQQNTYITTQMLIGFRLWIEIPQSLIAHVYPKSV